MCVRKVQLPYVKFRPFRFNLDDYFNLLPSHFTHTHNHAHTHTHTTHTCSEPWMVSPSLLFLVSFLYAQHTTHTHTHTHTQKHEMAWNMHEIYRRGKEGEVIE